MKTFILICIVSCDICSSATSNYSSVDDFHYPKLKRYPLNTKFTLFPPSISWEPHFFFLILDRWY